MNKDAKTSINRRTDIISAAIEVFAETGYYRATTAQVAQRVQISQPYVFRLFATKEQLLLSALEVSWLRIFESFHQVIESASSERLEAELIEAYEYTEWCSKLSVRWRTRIPKRVRYCSLPAGCYVTLPKLSDCQN